MYSPTTNAYNRYKTTSVQTANPGKLLLMLYDGLILFLKKGKQAVESGNPGEAHVNLINAQDIISELMSTLKMDYEISQNLFQLYDYWKRRVMDANIKKDDKIIDEVLSLVEDLRDVWAEAAGVQE
ncbi:MAG TPA: flagellar export chaperone FliS [Syntrophomonadaceae bacterium]|nr:flagellar export chaperone FliS [Syntrophomonadaceae bacterium]